MSGGARILVVDDEPIMCRYLRRILQSAGYEVEIARSGPEALSKIGGSPFQLVLADIIMPGMGGLDLLRRIKQQSPDITVIVMTGYASLQHATEAVRYEAYRYLTKPFESKEQVLDIVADALSYREDAG